MAAWKLLFYSGGIIFFFVLRELIQDGIYTTRYGEKGERFKFSIFLVFLQSLVSVIFSLLEPVLFPLVFGRSPKIETIPAAQSNQSETLPKKPQIQQPFYQRWFEFSLPALSQFLAGYLGNKSLEYIDLTTKTICKSVKPIPIMLLGILCGGNKHHPFRLFGVFLITASIVIFMLDGESSEETSDFIGFILSGMALIMDGVVAETQSFVTRKYDPSPSTLNFSTNFWGTIISFGTLYMSGELPKVLTFCSKYPDIFTQLIFFCLAAPIANHFIFLMITEFGSLQCSIVTTSRKFLTILINTVVYRRHISWVRWSCVGGLFVGLCLDTYGSVFEKRDKAQKAKKE